MNYIFGMHPVMEAIRSGKKIDKIIIKQGLEGYQFRELMEMLKGSDLAYQFVPAEKINHLAKGARHQGVAAQIAQIDYVPIEEAVAAAFNNSENPVAILLDGVSDVRNLGAIARTAECAGASMIILPAKGGASINAEAIKSSAGALMRMNICKVPNLRTALFFLQESGFNTIATNEKSDKMIYQADFTKPTAIVMGSEGKGISDAVLNICNESVRIPMSGEIGSLNVSVATSVVLFEMVRQRLK